TSARSPTRRARTRSIPVASSLFLLDYKTGFCVPNYKRKGNALAMPESAAADPFQLVELLQAAVSVEHRLRQRARFLERLGLTEIESRRAPAAEYRQPAANRDDLPPRPAFRRIGPTAGLFLKIEEHRDHFAAVIPIT